MAAIFAAIFKCILLNSALMNQITGHGIIYGL